ncbi:MAG: enoyl-CoA hydratase/isomerase family protein [Bacteroidales bacterium]|nr:enoyl-CoA hydratase/isomerase family protein [Bacteroidales bacterium]
MNSIVVKNKICCIYLDNQPQNYLTRPEFISQKELEDAVQSNDCIAIIISGIGRHFSAGADISTIHEMSRTGNLADELTAGKNLLQTMQSFNIPIVACVEGVCMGAGMEIMLNSDVCFASSKALFAFPESQANLMPGLSGTVKLTTAIGKKKKPWSLF